VRADGRAADRLRPVTCECGWISAPIGSVLIKQGQTWVLCTASVEDRVPRWLKGQGSGWLTASYNMLPGSTVERTARDRRGAGGRTREIERLIGRSLRAAMDLGQLGARTLHVDCDVLQADGGTRTAAITGGWLALALGVAELQRRSALPGGNPLVRQIAAVSVGVVDGESLLDLDYEEDVRAQTDMNVAMTAPGCFVEVQGTAEGEPFERGELDRLLDLAAGGIRTLVEVQTEVLRES